MFSQVSIIIPCYNQGKYLADALKSVLHQTYAHWECIIIDDGSTDNTESVAQFFCASDKRFCYIKQRNKGVSAARNLGLSLANGEFIQFLDGDDMLQPDKIAYQVEFLKTNTQVDIVYGSSRYFFTETPQELYPIHHGVFSPIVEMDFRDKNQKDVLLLINVCTICATLYRKKIFNKVNSFKSVAFEDWFFHIECSLNDYIFHYERFFNSYCLIRMTSESQMEQHHRQNNKKSLFIEEYNRLLKIHDYQSEILMSRSKLNLNREASVSKKIIRNITPPIFYTLASDLKKIFSN